MRITDKPRTNTLQDLMTYNVRVLLTVNQVNQKDLAKAMGISEATLSQKFSGRTRWNIEDIDKASHYLGVPASRFLESDMWGLRGLNPGPTDYESAALTD